MKNTQVETIKERKKLTSVIELIKTGFTLFFKGDNFVHILKFIGIQILLFAIVFIPVGILFYFFGAPLRAGNMPAPGALMFGIPVGLIFVITAIIIGLWTGIAIILAVNQIITGKLLGFKETLSLAWGKVLSYFGVSFLSGIIISLGFILLIIPGIIFSVWFSFAPVLVVLGGLGVFEALKKSKELISGYFWPVLGRFVVFGVLGMLISFVFNLIPLLGPLVGILTSPFFVLLHVLLFKDLQAVKA